MMQTIKDTLDSVEVLENAAHNAVFDVRRAAYALERILSEYGDDPNVMLLELDKLKSENKQLKRENEQAVEHHKLYKEMRAKLSLLEGERLDLLVEIAELKEARGY